MHYNKSTANCQVQARRNFLRNVLRETVRTGNTKIDRQTFICYNKIKSSKDENEQTKNSYLG